ncbi:hypothetical protein SDC9_67640 [bioreactor metagenome]|uniref:VWFA domain-containing protein n=1 Tax=bioreactor metagenome TaxID=1076179 RepID=A0A644XZ71_9ZZZZ
MTTTEPVSADVVLVVDVSTSMDYVMGSGTRWSALKTAADTFIGNFLTAGSGNRVSIAAYGGSNRNGNSKDDYCIIQNWTTDAAIAKASYNYSHVVGSGGLRQHYFNDTEYNYGATNSQAGFRGADDLLDNSTNKIKYVIYMSDGEANVCYANRTQGDLICTNIVHAIFGHNDSCYQWIYTPALTDGTRTCSYLGNYINPSTGEDSSAFCARSAVAQLADLVANYDVKVFTIGFSDDAASSSVLSNQYATYKSAEDGVQLNQVYQEISEEITLASKPWTVFDLMGSYVVFDSFAADSAGTPYATFDGTKKEITWDVAAQAEDSPSTTHTFTLSYYVTLNMTNLNVWGKDDGGNYKFNPSNGDTKLTYKITEKDGLGNVVRTHYAMAAFDVPEVSADIYTVTLNHYLDDAATPFKTETIKGCAGSAALNLDSKISEQAGITYTGRDVLNSSGATFAFTSANDGTVINYSYKTGHALTIHYVDELGTSLTGDYTDVVEYNSPYSVASPSIPGYHLQDATKAVVSGTMPSSDLTLTVVYVQDEYAVTYTFSGASPAGVAVPTDSSSPYHYNDSVAVLGVSSQPAGWTFNGWTIGGNSVGDTFTITGPTQLVGTWTQARYTLDEIYQFADPADLITYQSALTDAGQAAYGFIDQDARAQVLANDAYTDYLNGLAPTDTAMSYDDFVGDGSAYAAAALDEAEAARDAAMVSPLGTFHATYTDLVTGTTLENVYVKNSSVHPHGYEYSITPQTLPDFKTQLAEGSNPGTLTHDTTVLFRLVNDLFSVTVNHYLEVKPGTDGAVTVGGKNYKLQESVSGGSYNSEDTYTISANDYGGYTVNTSVSDHFGDEYSYTMGTGDATHSLYYDIAKYSADFTFTSTDNPSVSLPTAQTDLWHGIDTVTNPGITAPAGWDFKGWYTDEGLTAAYTFGTEVTSDLHLYGSWSRETYDVSFAFVGDKPASAAAPAAQEDIPFQGHVTEPDSSTYSGGYDTDSQDFTFLGWFKDVDGVTGYNFSDEVTANHTVYGKWAVVSQKYSYTVEHYVDGVKVFDNPGTAALNYGTAITDTQAAACAADVSDSRFTTAVGHNYLTFSSATGCTISENESSNIVRCYYVTNEYTLTIHYIYPDNSPAASDSTNEVAYGATYSVDAPSIAHHDVFLRPNDDSATLSGRTVAGTMPGHDVELTVVYTPYEQYKYIVNYYWTNLEGTDVSLGKYESTLIWNGDDYTVPAD